MSNRYRNLYKKGCTVFNTSFCHFRTYNQLWVRTQTDIQNVLNSEGQVLTGKAEKDREVESLFHISRELKDENEALKAEIDMLKNDLWKDSDLIKANLGMDKLTSK